MILILGNSLYFFNTVKNQSLFPEVHANRPDVSQCDATVKLKAVGPLEYFPAVPVF
jgi:hypothetical protein